MTSQWCETTLGAICDRVDGIIQTGPFGSQLHESDYSQEGTPVVMPKDIIEGRIITDSVARIASEHVERLSRHKLKPGDIVYGRRGDIGRQALIRKEQDGWLCGTGCLRLSLSATVIEPLFLHYYLRQESVISWISNQAVGATLPNLNTGILRSVPVRVPPLPVQRRIAGILSAYDELIENNQRRIKILEEMARSLYREWFVHFRFPGHENHPCVASSLGEIPKGWDIASFEQAAVFENGDRGKNYPSVSEFVDDGVPFINAGHLVDGGVDLSPIGELMKSEVYALGKELGIIQEILDARPTDGLWDDNRTDEDQLGMTYPELERAMENDKLDRENAYETIEHQLTKEEKSQLKKYRSIRSKNIHKMEPIPVCKLN